MKAQQWIVSLVAVLGAGLAQAGTQVGVSVGVSQPGFYGRIDIGNTPPPAVIYPQPVIIQQPAVVVQRTPIYLRVPPGHEKNWSRYCHQYNACAQPVYFVRTDAAVAPRARAGDFRDGRHEHKHGDKHGSRGEGKHGGKGHGHKHD